MDVHGTSTVYVPGHALDRRDASADLDNREAHA
jgi:hypothetical protein